VNARNPRRIIICELPTEGRDVVDAWSQTADGLANPDALQPTRFEVC
jgi:hypothetical protein